MQVTRRDPIKTRVYSRESQVNCFLFGSVGGFKTQSQAKSYLPSSIK